MQIKYTHKGWFLGLVPVYIANLDTEVPLIVERHWAFLPWFMAIEFLHEAYCRFRCSIDPDFEPLFAIKITGELK